MLPPCAASSAQTPAPYGSPLNQSPAYDLDGNLIKDGLWSYEWDEDTRLIRMRA